MESVEKVTGVVEIYHQETTWSSHSRPNAPTYHTCPYLNWAGGLRWSQRLTRRNEGDFRIYLILVTPTPQLGHEAGIETAKPEDSYEDYRRT
jgi:hypothetical protein